MNLGNDSPVVLERLLLHGEEQCTKDKIDNTIFADHTPRRPEVAA